jgi:sec-independent protein translocase protein TatA
VRVDLGPAELVIILVIVVLIFGTTRLKDLGGSLGQGIKEFRAAVKEDDESPAAPRAQGIAEAPTDAVAGGEVVAAVKCPSCESLNAQSSKFCDSCGAPLTASAVQN